MRGEKGRKDAPALEMLEFLRTAAMPQSSVGFEPHPFSGRAVGLCQSELGDEEFG